MWAFLPWYINGDITFFTIVSVKDLAAQKARHAGDSRESFPGTSAQQLVENSNPNVKITYSSTHGRAK